MYPSGSGGEGDMAASYLHDSDALAGGDLMYSDCLSDSDGEEFVSAALPPPSMLSR